MITYQALKILTENESVVFVEWQLKMEKIKNSVLNMDEKALPELLPKQKEFLDAFKIRYDHG